MPQHTLAQSAVQVQAVPAPVTVPLGTGLLYASLSVPLAMAALPVYMHWPHFQAQSVGAPLAQLGLLLLLTRCLDALLDPLWGQFMDRCLQARAQRLPRVLVLAAVMLSVGFWALWHPLGDPSEARYWLAQTAALLCTYLSLSVLLIAQQALATQSHSASAWQAQISAWREGLSLLGVVAASLLLAQGAQTLVVYLLPALLLLGTPALLASMRRLLPAHAPAIGGAVPGLASKTVGYGAVWQPLKQAAFRRLLSTQVFSAMSAAVAATLMPFFVHDVLADGSGMPLYLLTYFASALLAIPLWSLAARRWPLLRLWQVGMGLGIAAFACALAVDAGDRLLFVLVCAATGLALGADAVMPHALLTRVVQAAHPAAAQAGHFVGWWALCNKLQLALAAGLALPLLQGLGYQPSGPYAPAQGVGVLASVYVCLPIALKGLSWLCSRRLFTPAPELPTPAPASTAPVLAAPPTHPSHSAQPHHPATPDSLSTPPSGVQP